MFFDPAPLLTKLIFEIRYADGELYWDLSGRVRRSLRALDERWDFALKPDDGFWQCKRPMTEWKGLEGVLLHLNFGAMKTDFGLDPPGWLKTAHVPLDGLKGLIVQATQCVVDALSLERIIRLGFRCWQLFRVDGREDARRLLLAAPYCRPEERLGDVCGEQISVSLVDRYRSGQCESRVALEDTTAKLKTTGEERHGVLLDIDYSRPVGTDQEPDYDAHLRDGIAYVTALAAAVSGHLAEAAQEIT
jgi:hypothetical protein